MKILIAFDVDGTLTDANHLIPFEIINYLADLSKKGIKLSFITGRPSSWILNLLKNLEVSYILAAQNGAVVLKMPENKPILENMLNSLNIFEINKIYNEFFIYINESIYFIPDRINDNLLDYLKKRSLQFNEKLYPLSTFETLKNASISSVKMFLKNGDQAKEISHLIKEKGFSSYAIKDPFCSKYTIIQTTHSNANKGKTILFLKDYFAPIDFTIAIGDDDNDIPMFKGADCSLVMQDGSDEVKKYANHIVTNIITSLNDILFKKGMMI